MQELFSALSLWLSAHPLITGWYTAIARLLFPVLSALILVRAIRSLLRIPHTPEVWAQLSLPGGGSIPLTHWENILGRGKSADAILNYPSISRQHAALIRAEDDSWTVYDLDSKGGVAVIGIRTGAIFVPVFVDGKKRLFRKTRLIFGEPYRPTYTGRHGTAEEVQKIADEVVRRAYALGEEHPL